MIKKIYSTLVVFGYMIHAGVLMDQGKEMRSIMFCLFGIIFLIWTNILWEKEKE